MGTAERAARPERDASEDDELATLEAELDDQDGRRVLLQRVAREQLAADGAALTRLAVARRAVQLLHRAQMDRCP